MMETKKCLRTEYFRTNPWVREIRRDMGKDDFDSYYRNVHKWLNTLYFGQYIVVRDWCRKKPEYHDVFVACCDIYYHMDLFVNLEYNEETDTVTILRPTFPSLKTTDHYWPPDVYSKIMRNPQAWGIDPEDI